VVDIPKRRSEYEQNGKDLEQGHGTSLEHSTTSMIGIGGRQHKPGRANGAVSKNGVSAHPMERSLAYKNKMARRSLRLLKCERCPGSKDGLFTDTPVGEGDGDALVGMAGGVEDLQKHISEMERFALLHRISVGEWKTATVVDFRASAIREFRGANNVVLIPMGFENMGDAAPLPVSDVHIDTAIPTGIDYRGGALIPDDV
jgi:hypothetical protein